MGSDRCQAILGIAKFLSLLQRCLSLDFFSWIFKNTFNQIKYFIFKLSRLPFIFTGAIAAAVILTIFATSFFDPQVDFEPTIEEISAGPTGTFYHPRDIALNSTGDIFVLDTQNQRVQHFNADGGFNSTFGFADDNANDGSFFNAFGMHINSTNFIHIADTGTNVIKVFSNGGTYLKTIGTAGTGSGQYYGPSGLTMNSSHILIADTFNNRIQITDLSGNTVDTIP